MQLNNIRPIPLYDLNFEDGRDRWRFAICETGPETRRKYVVRLTHFIQFENFTQENCNLEKFVSMSCAMDYVKTKALQIVRSSKLFPGEQRRLYPQVFNK